MAPVYQLLLLGYVLSFGTSVNAQSLSTSLTCDHTVGVFFSSDRWTTRAAWRSLSPPNDVTKEQFFHVMRKILKITKDRGINCTFKKASQLLECCETGNLTRFQPVAEKDLTIPPKPKWGYNIAPINVALFFVNMFVMFIVMCWGLIMTIRFPETLIPAGLRQSIAMS